ncbi:hypothetical protein AN189_16750 [Loktanella sp. 3ANDIMAR09]|uniref:hypothetical protein n=1 Tax=Loktanella sp. 3ANDIMAR09 TaxID=1225657 RepID=UPI000707A490|nr:hypothetical protein [Loktanella sp. 3ANDIMAR09]KQI67138.1 hypothetical protein AN189_16750 [Loktanella sp. 3ANDIMAR09]
MTSPAEIIMQNTAALTLTGAAPMPGHRALTRSIAQPPQITSARQTGDAHRNRCTVSTDR